MNDEPKILAGRYEVGDLIGRGGMAEVHIGYDTRLGRTVAIKILRPDLARDPSFQTRFRREAQSAAGLNHPTIVAVYDTGEDTIVGESGNPQAVPFIVMEYVEGHTVRDILKGDVAAPIDEAVDIVAGVLAALEYSHHAGLVHRDIKPANVMLTPTGAVKVMDFGIARALADAGNTMTQTQAVVGTAQYLSPEQARGENVDARSDLYSTGCLLFELLTGRPPFIGDSPVSVAYQHVREAPPKPSDFASDVPPELDTVVLHALAKNRDERYGSAQEFLTDLRGVMAGGMPMGGIALGSAAAGAGVAGVAAAAAVAGMTNEEIADLPTQQMPATPAGPETGATAVMPAAGLAAGPAAAPWAAVGPASGAPTPMSGTVVVDDPLDAEEERRAKRNRYLLLGGAALLAIALIVALIVFATRGPSEPEVVTVQMPDIVGLSQADATAKLTELGLEGKYELEASEDVDIDTVIRTEPPANSELEEGDTVTVFISSGPGDATVPSVRGLTEAEATKQLEAANLVVGETVEEDNKDFDEGRVFETDPAEGTDVQAGTTVILHVSTGKVALPNLIGLQEDDARKQLTDLGLIPTVTDKEDDSKPAGEVLEQKPGAGEVDRNSTVELVVATAPTTTPVPNVVGQSRADAEQALGDAGLKSTATEATTDQQALDGKVVTQNPSANTEVKPGTNVAIVVGKYVAPQPNPTPTPTPSVTPAP
ncbi:Stk1 family PASTA domain-containing Ser/Thr kinase [Demequina aurantiaca]|uniref:Stk1 family PASTA domain-containing Ser/Thr kinase n=1 Tax=Demequina aurantiaca TaxID=676200 RepID=UPI0007834301|nr:Stk1 family PASTA domain-containing Ser/Thr kinase [Demequina aurantiaca]